VRHLVAIAHTNEVAAVAQLLERRERRAQIGVQPAEAREALGLGRVAGGYLLVPDAFRVALVVQEAFGLVGRFVGSKEGRDKHIPGQRDHQQVGEYESERAVRFDRAELGQRLEGFGEQKRLWEEHRRSWRDAGSRHGRTQGRPAGRAARGLQQANGKGNNEYGYHSKSD